MNLLGLFSRGGASDYAGLPTTSSPGKSFDTPWRNRINKRYVRIAFAAVLAVSVLVFLQRLGRTSSDPKLPPLYEKYVEYEREMPQHDLSLPFPEGKYAKFLWFDNHVACVYFLILYEPSLISFQGQAGETTCRKWF